MLTKNFYTAMVAWFVQRRRNTSTLTMTRDNGGVIDKVWSLTFAPYKNDSSDPSSYTSIFEYMYYGTEKEGGFGVRFGTGSTPADRADYKLENQITTGISCSSGTIAKSFTDSYAEVSSTIGVTNTGSDPVTIRELGLFAQAMTGLSFNTYESAYCLGSVLVDRTVLENPITIEPGATEYITYTIRINYPS